jgi:hypothetical protein
VLHEVERKSLIVNDYLPPGAASTSRLDSTVASSTVLERTCPMHMSLHTVTHLWILRAGRRVLGVFWYWKGWIGASLLVILVTEKLKSEPSLWTST